jgi:hypothetical protein
VLSGADPDSSSVFGDRVVHRRLVGSITVPGITMQDMLSGYGATLFYVKVDIDGRIDTGACLISGATLNRLPELTSAARADTR